MGELKLMKGNEAIGEAAIAAGIVHAGADYVYLEDAGSPQIAQVGDKPPIWYKFYRKDSGGGGKPPKPPKP